MVRFDRGDAANALSFAIMRELTNVAHDLADDSDLCAVVLTGRNDNFCLGMDQFALTQYTEDCAEGLRAFLPKKDPVFTGR